LALAMQSPSPWKARNCNGHLDEHSNADRNHDHFISARAMDGLDEPARPVRNAARKADGSRPDAPDGAAVGYGGGTADRIEREVAHHARIPLDEQYRRLEGQEAIVMLALKWLLMAAGVAMFGTAAGVVGYDVYLTMQFQKLMGSGGAWGGREGELAPPYTLASRRQTIRMGVGIPAAGSELRVRAGRLGRNSNQPNLGSPAGNAVSRSASGHAAGAARGRI